MMCNRGLMIAMSAVFGTLFILLGGLGKVTVLVPCFCLEYNF